MINEKLRHELQAAGMPPPQAKVVAAYMPDGSQFATKQEIKSLRWLMLAGFVALLVLPNGWLFPVVQSWLVQVP